MKTQERPTRLVVKLLLLVIPVVLIILYIFNASRPGYRIEGCPEGCATSLDRAAGPLRVVLLNMLHGFPTFTDLSLRAELIAGEIKRLDADVILLQEVPWTVRTGNIAKYLANQLYYNYVFYRAEGNKSLIFFETGQAILSRFPLRDIASIELKPRMSFFESRVALASKVITPWGEVAFIATHLTNKDLEVGYGQAQALRNFVRAYTNGVAVVAGDFNAREDSPQIMELSTVWIDAYRVAHPHDPGLTCCIDDLHAWSEEPLKERIDYIFLVNFSGWLTRVEHAFYHPFQVSHRFQWASDHTGLMLEFEP